VIVAAAASLLFVACGKTDLPKTLVNEKTGQVMILIPAGEFTMGSIDGEGDERPVRRIYLDAYYVDKTPVTNRAYRRFLEAIKDADTSPYEHPSAPVNKKNHRPQFGQNELVNADDQPVVGIDFFDAWAYAKWAGLALPTEAQWEKAVRGTDGRQYPWGNESPELPDGRYRANYNQRKVLGGLDTDGYRYTSPINAFERSVGPYGLLDGAGNVWEWTRAFYEPGYYANMPRKNPPGPPLGMYVTIRGGSWKFPSHDMRCASRKKMGLDDQKKDIGFRCVLEP